jgi:hypothetical protein
MIKLRGLVRWLDQPVTESEWVLLEVGQITDDPDDDVFEQFETVSDLLHAVGRTFIDKSWIIIDLEDWELIERMFTNA